MTWSWPSNLHASSVLVNSSIVLQQPHAHLFLKQQLIPYALIKQGTLLSHGRAPLEVQQKHWVVYLQRVSGYFMMNLALRISQQSCLSASSTTFKPKQVPLMHRHSWSNVKPMHCGHLRYKAENMQHRPVQGIKVRVFSNSLMEFALSCTWSDILKL
jgi:hypothetical protein